MSRVMLVEGAAGGQAGAFNIEDFRFVGRLPRAERMLLKRVMELEGMLRAKAAQVRALRSLRQEGGR